MNKLIYPIGALVLVCGKVLCQSEPISPAYAFEIDQKLSIGLLFPMTMLRVSYSNHLPLKYGMRFNDSYESKAFFVIDTIPNKEYRNFQKQKIVDTIRTSNGLIISFLQWRNGENYNYFTNAIAIIDNKMISLSLYSDDLTDYEKHFKLYKKIVSSLEKSEMQVMEIKD